MWIFFFFFSRLYAFYYYFLNRIPAGLRLYRTFLLSMWKVWIFSRAHDGSPWTQRELEPIELKHQGRERFNHTACLRSTGGTRVTTDFINEHSTCYTSAWWKRKNKKRERFSALQKNLHFGSREQVENTGVGAEWFFSERRNISWMFLFPPEIYVFLF